MAKNLKLFREMSEPFESKELALEAITGFLEAVSAAREQFKITNVLTTIALNYLVDGDEAAVSVAHMLGDDAQAEAMAATTFGQMRAEREEFIAKRLRGAKK